jgi:hypothetical protein
MKPKISPAVTVLRRFGDPTVHIPLSQLRDPNGDLIGISTYDGQYIRRGEYHLFLLTADVQLCERCLAAMNRPAA